MSVMWNLWHGCHRYSEGCLNCYVYRGDAKYDRITDVVVKTAKFYMPIEKNKKGEYKVKSGEIINTCFSSDFLVEDADDWRQEAWDMIRERKDCNFMFITKRIDRFHKCLPADWGNGWENVIICCTCESQKQFNYRMPIFLNAPIKHKCLIMEPLLDNVDISKMLTSEIEQVVVGGESGQNARVCDYNWIINIRNQCVKQNVSFHFKQTGTYFKKEGKIYKVARQFQHSQSRAANLRFNGHHKGYI